LADFRIEVYWLPATIYRRNNESVHFQRRWVFQTFEPLLYSCTRHFYDDCWSFCFDENVSFF